MISHTPDRWLSKAGLASRGEVLEWVAQGRLTLGGESLRPESPVSSPSPRCPGEGRRLPPFFLDGVLLVPPPPLLLCLNKPRGVLVTLSDPEGRPVVGDFLRRTPWSDGSFGRIRPLGRLDAASAGLLLLTNYPEPWSHFLSPEGGVRRRYRVKIRPGLRAEDRKLFLSGKAGEGAGYRRVEVEIEREGPKSSWLLISLVEGRNREIRNVLTYHGYEVLHLIRLAFGPFLLGDLKPGEVSCVTEEAKKAGVVWERWESSPYP